MFSAAGAVDLFASYLHLYLSLSLHHTPRHMRRTIRQRLRLWKQTMTGSPNNVGSSRTDMKQEPCPEGSVPLHRLCHRCRGLFNDWTEVYAWFDDAQNVQRMPDFESETSELCIIADLTESRASCHFCEMLFSKIEEQDPMLLQHSVACRLNSSWDEDLVYITISINGNVESSKLIYIRPFAVGYPNDVFDVPFIAQHVPRHPADNLVQIQRWLHTCLENHDTCNNWCPNLGMKQHRPTRVLELSQSGVKLRCDLRAIETFEYLALSHMWGTDSSNQLRLTMVTLQKFQEAIPLASLPSVFSEAIRITRYLGYKYLWIDSLCIIQDSEYDWMTEANMMSAVYNNAVCTIAFLFPPDVGVYRPRDCPPALTPCIVRAPTETKDGIYVVPREQEDSRFLHKRWPLSSRAWTFQENILSPRTLLCGHRTLMWECVERFSDELAGTWVAQRTREREGFPHMPQRALLYSLPSSESPERIGTPGQQTNKDKFSETFPNWARSIKEYRRRDLTKSSDRIIAFAGVAQAFQAEHGFVYLAGMWKEHLPRSLLWYLVPAKRWMNEPLIAREPLLKSVPTWSWFASPMYLDHQYLFVYSRRCDEDNVLFLARFVRFKRSTSSVSYKPATAYYDFGGLQITLKVATYTTTILPRESRRNDESLRLCCGSLETQIASLLRVSRECVRTLYCCDDFKDFSQPPVTMYLALITEEWENFNGGRTLFEGLALAPGAEKDTWMRVGYWNGWVLRLDDSEGSSSADTIKWGQGSAFLRLEGVKMEKLTLV